ncbi:imm11 family protein [Clostridium sp. UBA6640]|uniref:imm11 family protein n=1 Tax=Clostridium sp. UBA6640 TaxID=1946370 RepID=UPI0025C46EB9|nr:DUF1629 domain-containing protein [Clostridium sp. UBA6640]
MIWIWSIPDEWPNKRIGIALKNTGTDRFEFLEGKILDENTTVCPNVVFDCEEKFLSDVLPNSGSLLIVSRRVLNIIENLCKCDYQVFEANIFVGKNKVNGYYLLNILNPIEILDKSKSVFVTMKNSNAIFKFRKIVYKEDDLINHSIARNADYVPHVLVSQELKEIFEKEKIKGVEFRIEP